MSLLSCFLGLVLLIVSSASNADSRWYSEIQVEQGAKLFTENCMTCHGTKAQGTKEWKKRDKDGNFPPPPLNGDAHAWHHSLDLLRRTIREGGINTGGNMPPFNDKLNKDQIDAVIAYFQSQWNDRVYTAWNSRNKPPTIKPLLNFPEISDENSSLTTYLRKTMPTNQIGTPEKVAFPEVFQIKLGNKYAYLSKDGRYLLTGELIDLKTQKNLTREQNAKDMIALMADFPEKSKIVYPAEGVEKSSITVFTDVSCPYCKKLHSEVPSLQRAGVTVKYIAFPRSGLQGSAYQTMKSVWCAKDRQNALGVAKGTHSGTVDKKDCEAGKAVDDGYALGKSIAISGTPAILTEKGVLIEGYIPQKQLLKRLCL